MDTQDLDILVPPLKRVKFGGREFTLPGDMPMETFLQINLAGEQEKETHQMDALIDAIAMLFTMELNPDVDPEAVRSHVSSTLRKRGVRYAFKLLGAIYTADEAEEKGDEDPPVEAGQVPQAEG